MAKTQDIKRRIRSVRNTMQVTKAMKMVSAAKLRRAQERMVQARPHAANTLRLLRSVAARTNPELHPLLQPRGDERLALVVVTADKGLCGAFNAGIIRMAEAFLAERGRERVAISCIGRKGRDYLGRRVKLARQWTDVFRVVEVAKARQIAGELVEGYLAGEADAVYLVFNEFKSALQPRPVMLQLLPVEPAALEPGEPSDDYIYEPSAAAILERLLPRYVENQLYQALLESSAAEHAARMTAMDNASSNAGELIDSLTLRMNRVRQASITTEIIEVVSGAQAQG